MVYNLCFRLRNLTYYYRNVEVPSDQIFTLILVICLQFATRVLSILHTTFTPHYETKVAHYQFSLSRTPRIMTTSLIMVLPPCLRDFFSAWSDSNNNYNLRNYDTDLSIPKLKKEFFKGSFGYRGAVLWNSLSYVSYEAKTAQSIHSFKGLILINIHVIMWFVGVHN